MKLHIGCGEKYLPGYKHVDVISREHVDFAASADSFPFVNDNTVDEIYVCHVAG